MEDRPPRTSECRYRVWRLTPASRAISVTDQRTRRPVPRKLLFVLQSAVGEEALPLCHLFVIRIGHTSILAQSDCPSRASRRQRRDPHGERMSLEGRPPLWRSMRPVERSPSTPSTATVICPRDLALPVRRWAN